MIVHFVCDCVQACCVLGLRLATKLIHDRLNNSISFIAFVVEQESFTAHYTVHSCNASCHGNRVCTGSNDCICQTGYRRVDCGIAVCPNNCSNNGVCDMVRTLHPYTYIHCVNALVMVVCFVLNSPNLDLLYRRRLEMIS